MTQIILAVIALGASILAYHAAHTAKEIFDDLEVRIWELNRKFEALKDTTEHSADTKAFDALDRKIDQQAKAIDRQTKRITWLGNKHNHLCCVVMQHIQEEGEEHASE